MKKFLCIYTGTPDGMASFAKLPKAEQTQREAEGMTAWKNWATAHAASIVDSSGPLGPTKRVSKSGVTDTRNDLCAFVIVQAESRGVAAALFTGHPHFSVFPGDGVDVMEVLPVPGGQP